MASSRLEQGQGRDNSGTPAPSHQLAADCGLWSVVEQAANQAQTKPIKGPKSEREQNFGLPVRGRAPYPLTDRTRPPGGRSEQNFDRNWSRNPLPLPQTAVRQCAVYKASVPKFVGFAELVYS